MKSKWIAIVLALLCIICGSTACSRKEETVSGPVFSEIQLDPTVGSSNTGVKTVKLYFANEDYTMLLSEEVTVEVPVSSRVENSVLDCLIAGPKSSGATFKSLVNPKTKVIKIEETEEFISVILSEEFLDWSFIADTDISVEKLDHVKKLAVYSIVNSLVEASACKKVQILIEEENSRTGRRLSLYEVGMSGSGVLEPLGREGKYVLSAQNTLQDIFSQIMVADYTGVYWYVAYNDADGEVRPSENNFSVWMKSLDLTLEDYRVTEFVEPTETNTALLMMDYTVSIGETGRKQYEDIPVKLIRENGVWKIHYSMLKSLF